MDQRLDVKKKDQAWMLTRTLNGGDDGVFDYEEDIKWEEMKT